MASSNFRVIVVGGGPVGLTAAHALSRAGIDFLILEMRPSAVIDAGSNLVLDPQGLRALSQLGFFDAINEVTSELKTIDRFDHEGNEIGTVEWFHHTKENFGVYPRCISRHDLTKVLYDHLSPEAQSKILVNKKVAEIASIGDGVAVSCTDGTYYAGSIILGADGAHSMVRRQMRQLALAAASPDINDEQPFLTTYQCMWVRFPIGAGNLTPGYTAETHGHNASTQLFAGLDTAVIGIYERLPAPTRERIRFTPADAAALIARLGHLPLTKGGDLTVQKAYDAKLEAGMIALEEGVVPHWSWAGRIVLTGDAAHKYHPITGAGCNNGIVDVVALANELHRAFLAAERSSGNPSAAPSRAEVAAAFAKYQEARFAGVTETCETAGNLSETATWQSGFLELLDRHVMSLGLVQRFLSAQDAGGMAKMQPFYFADKEERVVGKVPWLNRISSN